MEHSLPLISTLVIAFSLALIFGFIAERFFRAPPLVGYLLAGIAAGKYTPGVFADPALANQLSEIGVMLLMFGVGLHFSFKDLLKVKGIAVPGAIVQMFIATLLGGLIAHYLWDWNWGRALVLGLCLSCASTVVLIKALEVRGILNSLNGQIAVGWLVVEDIATVLILVLLPVVAGLANHDSATVITARDIAWQLGKTLFNVGAFIAVMLIAGRKLLPWALSEVARTGSRELFTLFILAIAVGVAYGAASVFQVSFALGAFFAGAVMRESSFAHKAASETLPFQDAFSVLFFVGVGMLFDWHILLHAPLQVLTVVFIIMVGKALAAFALVHLLRHPLHTSLTVSAALAQIGEFSFILVVQAQTLDLADTDTLNLIVGAAIISIALNPVAFYLIPKLRTWLVQRWAWAKVASQRQGPLAQLTHDAHQPGSSQQPVVLVGTSRSAIFLLRTLHNTGVPMIGLVDHHELAQELTKEGLAVVDGNPTDPQALMNAKVMRARQLILFDTTTEALRIVELAHTLNRDLAVLIIGKEPGIWEEMPQQPGLTFINAREAAMLCAAESIRGALQEGRQAGNPVGRPLATESSHTA
ncbi:MAG: cation:proton antiporter [Sutterella sp.]|nr:cation:proton antiporter [Sutterella sp.]